MMQKIWRGIELSFQNWHKEFDEFWRKHSKVSKSCTFIGTFWAKYILLELKWYIWVIFHDTEEWCKIWKKNRLVVWKMVWGIWQIFTRALESLKIGTLMGSFYPKQKMYELKVYKGVMCHDSEEWCKKYGAELTCRFKIDLRNLTNFWPE